MKIDMKVILALLLCGVAYSTASPTCSESELDKCSMPPIDDEDYKATEEFLNLVCKSMGCMKDYKSRCGVDSVEDYFKSMLVHSEKVYKALCEADSQALRKKYLENAKCVNRLNIRDECNNGEMIEIGDPDFCPRVKEILDCSNDLIGRECGKEAREVNIAISPGLEFHGCKE